MKNLGRAVRGAVASNAKMAPAMGGAVASASKRMQPAIDAAAAASKAVQARGLNESNLARSAALFKKMEKMGRMPTVSQPKAAQAAAMPRKAPLGGLRSAVKTAATNVKTAVAKQPALQKAVASQANKPVGRLVGGLSSKFLKRR